VLYILTLASSITLYRLSPLHPLYVYPGPLLARVSRFYATYATLDGRQHLVTQALHARYGPVVRTGPNHLHICDATAVLTILSARSGWWRSEREWSCASSASVALNTGAVQATP
jgi:hypothetical protein